MDILYFYVCYQVKQKQFDVRWHPGQENLGDYTSKHHLEHQHMQLRPIYLQMDNSQKFLPRAVTLRDQQGCVGKAEGGYIQGHTLPLIPILRL